MLHEPIPVAIVQARPVHLDLAACMDKAAELIDQAAATGARLVTFGETWLPGYPAWIDTCPSAALWGHESTKGVYARLRRNSLLVPGPETQHLGELARKHKIVLVMGAHERIDRGSGSGTLYNVLLTFGPDGSLLNHHRKLVPTYTERLVWGPGDGRGLKAVDTPAGRVSGLICWEHWMPLARQVLHADGEDVHIAAWPGVHEMLQIASRHYAFEGRCYVLAAGSLMTVADLPEELPPTEDLAGDPEAFIVHGGSAVIGPDGKYVVEPVFDEERILTATLDPDAIEKERMTLDVTGHYHRPDVFEVWLKKEGNS